VCENFRFLCSFFRPAVAALTSLLISNKHFFTPFFCSLFSSFRVLCYNISVFDILLPIDVFFHPTVEKKQIDKPMMIFENEKKNDFYNISAFILFFTQ
jgi:hypothetical protein